MKKKANLKHGLAMTVFVVLIAFAFAGCDMLIGPQGEIGEQGEQGLSGDGGLPGDDGIYLVDADGVRILSGGSYFLGTVAAEGTQSISSTLVLHNRIGFDLDLMSIDEVTSYLIRPDGSLEKVGSVNEIDVAFSAQTIEDGSMSTAITFTLDYFGWGDWGYVSSLARKRFRIHLTEDGDDSVYFDVEAYGVLISGC